MNDRGIIYLSLGRKMACVLAVSLFTLRRHFAGPVTIFADAEPITREIAKACGADVREFATEGRRAYAAKPMLPAMSPYAKTIQVDADTTWAGSPEPLFDMVTPEGCIFTSFSTWVTTGNRMRGRFACWKKTDPEKYAAIVAKPWPALNTGVVAYGDNSEIARDVWLRQTLQNPKEFIVDETAANLLLPFYGPDKLLVVGDEWNWSPKFGKAPIEDVKITHQHGRKHTKDARMAAVWVPAFKACWHDDFAEIRSWCPAGDKRLGEYLQEHPDMLE